MVKATWQAMIAMPVDSFPRLLPGVHAIASPFILWRLKRLGFSNCRVVARDGGLAVFADR